MSSARQTPSAATHATRNILLALLLLTVVSGGGVAAQNHVRLEDRFFDSNGVRIRYVDIGKGEPLVLVHGILGSVEINWQDTGVLDRLSPHFRVIALDMRGHGKSGKPHEASAYGSEMADDVSRLLDHLGLRQAHILGYSLGGFVVGDLLARHPERFTTAIFGGSAPWRTWTADDERRVEPAAQEYERGVLTSLIRGTAPVGAPPPSDSDVKQTSENILHGQDRYAIAAVRRSYKGLVVTDAQVLAAHLPLLAVVGSDDAYLKDVQELKKLRPDLQVVVIQGATHNAPRNARERPEFSEAVQKFVDAHAAGFGSRPGR